MVKVLCMAGSVSATSINRQAMSVVVSYLEEKGVECVFVDLRDYAMPFVDGFYSVEDNDKAQALARAFHGCDGYIISTPEYNGMMPGVLKNTIDWLSFSRGGDTVPFKGKPAAIMAVSLGRLGGLKALWGLRDILNTLGSFVVPVQVGVCNGAEAFGDGCFADGRTDDMIKEMLDSLLDTIAAFSSQDG